MTMIPISKETRQRLKEHCIKADTYDNAIKRLLTFCSKFQSCYHLEKWFEESFHKFGFKNLQVSTNNGRKEYSVVFDDEKKCVAVEIFASDVFKRYTENNIDIMFCLINDLQQPPDGLKIIEIKEFQYLPTDFVVVKIDRMAETELLCHQQNMTINQLINELISERLGYQEVKILVDRTKWNQFTEIVRENNQSNISAEGYIVRIIDKIIEEK